MKNILVIIAALPLAFGAGALGAFLPNGGFAGSLFWVLGIALALDAVICFWLIGRGRANALSRSLDIFLTADARDEGAPAAKRLPG